MKKKNDINKAITYQKNKSNKADSITNSPPLPIEKGLPRVKH